MEPSDLLVLLAEKLERLQLSYFVTGSIATIIYGEPRFTNDIDVVVQLHADDVELFCQGFPSPDFYVSEEAVNTAIRNCRQFNIIHPSSGLNIDVMVPMDCPYNASRFQRKQQLRVAEGNSIWFGSPEDVILKKLDYYQQGQSDKHIRDILGVMKIQGQKLDRGYIDDWSTKLKLANVWQSVKSQLEYNA